MLPPKSRLLRSMEHEKEHHHGKAARATGWLSPGNHNHLRITRILRCLTVLGLEAEAKAFFGCLSEIYEDEQNKTLPALSDETMLYWRRAVGDAGRSE